MTTYTAAYLRTLPAPSLKKLLRQAGWSQRDVGRTKVPPCSHVHVGRVLKKGASSRPLWEHLAWCLNHPRPRNGNWWAA